MLSTGYKSPKLSIRRKINRCNENSVHAMQVFGRRRQLKHSHSAPWVDRNGILS